MQTAPKFADVLDSVEQLADDEQKQLVEIIRRRLIERRRARLAAEVAEARAEYDKGNARPARAEEVYGPTVC